MLIQISIFVDLRVIFMKYEIESIDYNNIINTTKK